MCIVHFHGGSKYFWSIWLCIASNILPKYPNTKFKLSKFTLSWHFLLGLAIEGVTVDSASESFLKLFLFFLRNVFLWFLSLSGFCPGVAWLFFFNSCFAVFFLHSHSELYLIFGLLDFNLLFDMYDACFGKLNGSV